MSTGKNHLGSEVKRRAAQSVGLIIHHFGKSEIYDDAIPEVINEHILRLKIAIKDASPVHVGQPLKDASGVELDFIFGDAISIIVVHDVKEFPSLYEVKQHEDTLFVLVGVDEFDDKGMINFGHDLQEEMYRIEVVVSQSIQAQQTLHHKSKSNLAQNLPLAHDKLPRPDDDQ